MTLYNRGDPTSRKMEVIIAMLDHHGKYRWSKWPRFIGTWLLSAIYLRLLGQWSRFKLCLVKSQKIVWRRPGMLQASVWVHEQYECGGWEYGWFKNLVVMDQRAFVFATRGHCIKGKQCYHIAIKNKICVCVQNNLAYFLFLHCPLMANWKARWSNGIKI